LEFLRVLNIAIINFFPFWIASFAVITYLYPHHFVRHIPLITPLLGVIMFGMGTTLTAQDFKRILTKPLDIVIGTAAQFIFMPLLGFMISMLFGLEPLLAAGIVLLGACPGGTASNVITYLSKGNVAFSVSLTAVSTLASPVLTPLLTYLYAGEWLDIPVEKLFLSTIKIVLIPVVLGLGVRWLAKDKIKTTLDLLPVISAMAIIFVVGIIVANNTETIKSVGLITGAAVISHNALGLVLGFWTARLFGMDKGKARALSIEVGMQNSGLAVALASQYFGALAALPSALFSIWHNIVGSFLALWWRRDNHVLKEEAR